MNHYIPSIKKTFDKISNVFDDFYTNTCSIVTETIEDEKLYPPSEIIKKDNKYILTMELAGYNPKDINVSLGNNYLVITGTKLSKSKDDKILSSTIQYGSFEKKIYVFDDVDDDVDIANIEASYENGVLTVVIPTFAKLTTENKIKINIK